MFSMKPFSRHAVVGVVAMFGLVALGLSACSSTATTSGTGSSPGSTSQAAVKTIKPSDTFKLGVSLALNNTDWWSSYIQYEQKYAKQYNAQLLAPIVNNNNSGQQITDIHTLINEGAQALIVNPVDSAAIKPALDFAASKGIPVVSVDVAPTAGKVFMIVRANNKLYGQEACKYIGEHVKSGTVAQLEGDLSSLNGRDRSTAFLSCMKANYPNLKVNNYPTKWDSSTAVNAATTALGSVQDLRAIYTQWSGPVPGIIQAVKAANKQFPQSSPNHIYFVSDDGVPFELADIRNGTLDATISQPADQYAKYAVYYSRQALEGKTYKANGQTGHDNTTFVGLYGNLEDPLLAPVVTKANVDSKALWGNNFASK